MPLSQDILYSGQEGGAASVEVGQAALEEESDSEDGWKAAFYSCQPDSNCRYIDYNKSLNPNP